MIMMYIHYLNAHFCCNGPYGDAVAGICTLLIFQGDQDMKDVMNKKAQILAVGLHLLPQHPSSRTKSL